MTIRVGEEILNRAVREPQDVLARIDAAYYCDAHLSEQEAIEHYDAAWKLGVPADQKRVFMIGYGSTLKNVGRLEESEAILRQAASENPGDHALRIFLALTVHAQGRSSQAIADLLNVLLEVGENDDAIQGYRRALAHYACELAAEVHT